jgi:two-component system OmpR family response regulator
MRRTWRFTVLRRFGAGSHLPVVFLTARDDTETRNKGLPAGRRLHHQALLLEESGRPDPRRCAAAPRGATTRRVLRYADLELDEDATRCARRHPHRPLPTEFKLLRYLLRER